MNLNPSPTPPLESAEPGTYLRIVAEDDFIDPPLAEPTDEELWLAGVAAQVETDARPLFAATWIWLLRQALQADEDEPA